MEKTSILSLPCDCISIITNYVFDSNTFRNMLLICKTMNEFYHCSTFFGFQNVNFLLEKKIKTVAFSKMNKKTLKLVKDLTIKTEVFFEADSMTRISILFPNVCNLSISGVVHVIQAINLLPKKPNLSNKIKLLNLRNFLYSESQSNYPKYCKKVEDNMNKICKRISKIFSDVEVLQIQSQQLLRKTHIKFEHFILKQDPKDKLKRIPRFKKLKRLDIYANSENEIQSTKEFFDLIPHCIKIEELNFEIATYYVKELDLDFLEMICASKNLNPSKIRIPKIRYKKEFFDLLKRHIKDFPNTKLKSCCSEYVAFGDFFPFGKKLCCKLCRKCYSCSRTMEKEEKCSKCKKNFCEECAPSKLIKEITCKIESCKKKGKLCKLCSSCISHIDISYISCSFCKEVRICSKDHIKKCTTCKKEYCKNCLRNGENGIYCEQCYTKTKARCMDCYEFFEYETRDMEMCGFCKVLYCPKCTEKTGWSKKPRFCTNCRNTVCRDCSRLFDSHLDYNDNFYRREIRFYDKNSKIRICRGCLNSCDLCKAFFLPSDTNKTLCKGCFRNTISLFDKYDKLMNERKRIEEQKKKDEQKETVNMCICCGTENNKMIDCQNCKEKICKECEIDCICCSRKYCKKCHKLTRHICRCSKAFEITEKDLLKYGCHNNSKNRCSSCKGCFCCLYNDKELQNKSFCDHTYKINAKKTKCSKCDKVLCRSCFKISNERDYLTNKENWKKLLICYHCLKECKVCGNRFFSSGNDSNLICRNCKNYILSSKFKRTSK